VTGLRWGICLAAATHALGFTAPLTDYGQRTLVIHYAWHLLEHRR
jgi:hypothetical protein